MMIIPIDNQDFYMSQILGVFRGDCHVIEIAKTFLHAAVMRMMAGRPDRAEGVFNCPFVDGFSRRKYSAHGTFGNKSGSRDFCDGRNMVCGMDFSDKFIYVNHWFQTDAFFQKSAFRKETIDENETFRRFRMPIFNDMQQIAIVKDITGLRCFRRGIHKRLSYHLVLSMGWTTL